MASVIRTLIYIEGCILLASIVSPPSDLNGQLYIYIYVTHTVHTVMLYVLLILRAHSHSPTMHSIELGLPIIVSCMTEMSTPH